MLENEMKLHSWKDEMILVHASRRSEDQSIADIRFWQNLDEQARLDAAWQIAKAVHWLRGKSEDELRMDKSTGRAIRRQGYEEPFDPAENFVFTLRRNYEK